MTPAQLTRTSSRGEAVDERRDRRPVAHVEALEAHPRRGRARGLDLGVGGAGRQHLGAERGEGPRHGRADAGGAAGDQHLPPGEEAGPEGGERRQRMNWST